MKLWLPQPHRIRHGLNHSRRNSRNVVIIIGDPIRWRCLPRPSQPVASLIFPFDGRCAMRTKFDTSCWALVLKVINGSMSPAQAQSWILGTTSYSGVTHLAKITVARALGPRCAAIDRKHQYFRDSNYFETRLILSFGSDVLPSS
jgi:hypothetical protein